MEVTNVKVLHKEPFLYLNSSSYINNAGKLKSWTWAGRPHNVSAVMVAATHGDKLVLIKEFRVPINGYIWGFPAGLVERGESPEDTAKREIFEETGLTISNYIRSTSPTTRTSPGMTDERLSIVFACATGIPNTRLLEDTEDIEVHLLTRIEVAHIIERGDEIDSKAYLIMLRFVEDGKI
jgi:ADP-ribose pyrophosphatase